MPVALSILVFVALLVIGWLATRPPSASTFKRRVYSLLEELGLDLSKIGAEAHKRFAIECGAVHHATKRFNPKRLAILLFTWHVTKQPLALAGLRDGAAVTDAILVIQRWFKRDKSLDGVAQNEINKLVSFVCDELERSHLPRERVIEAQLDLLALVSGAEITEAGLERIADEIVEEHKRSMS